MKNDPLPGKNGDETRADPRAYDTRLEEILDAFVAARMRGENPSIGDFATDHPDLAERVHELFPALAVLAKFPESGGASGSGPGAREKLPETLGEYRLLREIGRGGMGVVYEAEDKRLRRRVALKVLPFHALTDAHYIERFRREALAAAGLQHPGVTQVYDVGSDAGIHFYTMQYVEGDSLDRVLGEVRRIRTSAARAAPSDDPSSTSALAWALCSDRFAALADATPSPGAARNAASSPRSESPTPRAIAALSSSSPPSSDCYFRSSVRALCTVTEAVAHAHEKGVLHRDIKPANVLLDVQGHGWLTDFGLAKALEGDGDPSLTQSGEMVGTLRYMAPERFRGRCDARSDIFALGLTLYELLTTEAAFQAGDRAALIKQVSESSPPSPRSLEPRLPAPLERIILKAIQRDPEMRYATARDMAQDLSCFLEGRRVVVNLPGRRQAVGAFLRRRWRPVIATLFAILAFSAMLLWWQAIHRPSLISQVLPIDLGGDGDIDLVTANSKSDSITLLENHAGVFSVAAHYEVNNKPRRMAVADFDGDGVEDVVVVAFESGESSFFRGRKSGTLVPGRDLGLEAWALAAHAADIDNDKDADLLVCAKSGLYLLKNHSGGNFEEPVKLKTHKEPFEVAVADLDGDDDNDIAVQYFFGTASPLVSVLKNQDGIFAEPDDYTLPTHTWSVDAWDLDGDGDLDLAVPLYEAPAFSLLFNRGDGTFEKKVQISLGASIQSLAAGDFDGDGHLDLAGAGSDDHVCVLLGRGDGTFKNPVRVDAGPNPMWIEAMDFDGDGSLDLVVSYLHSESLWFYRNDGQGGFDDVKQQKLSHWRRFLKRK